MHGDSLERAFWLWCDCSTVRLLFIDGLYIHKELYKVAVQWFVLSILSGHFLTQVSYSKISLLVVSVMVTVAKWLQWLACGLSTQRHWLRMGSSLTGSVGGVPDHA